MLEQISTTHFWNWLTERERGLILWIFCVILLMKTVKGEDSVKAEYLISSHRFDTSAYVDSYFCCNICGGGIVWLVNDNVAVGHLSSQKAGSVSYQTRFRDSNTLQYLSILLSTRSENDTICMDVVLLVSQLEEEFSANPPRVICRGPILQQEIQVPMPMQQLSPNQTRNGTVTLNHIFGRSNIVSPGNDYVTHIFVCNTNESAQFWQHNRQPAGGFNGIHSAGFSEFTLASSDPSISSREAVLLVKDPQENLTSILLLTDINASANFTVLCGSNRDFVFSVVDSSTDNSWMENSTNSTSTTSTTTEINPTEEVSEYSDVSVYHTTESDTALVGPYTFLVVSLNICIVIISLAVFFALICIFRRYYTLRKWISGRSSCNKNSSDVEYGHKDLSFQGKEDFITLDHSDSMHSPEHNAVQQNKVNAIRLQHTHMDQKMYPDQDCIQITGKNAQRCALSGDIDSTTYEARRNQDH